ncbi:MAG: aldehyde ferredoxin oxidoreductase C-terminal domain-containing protein [Bacillota bacterium]|nr:aldehyde ferredoxin oxidoreductase C-terminal domain-containing protein [Bacillota bacterium]
MTRIHVDFERCSGCRSCEMACSVAHDGKFGTSISRIRVAKMETSGVDVPVVCRHCSDPSCAEACPVEAISTSLCTGARAIDATACTGCGACAEACPFGAMHIHPATGKAITCDLCGGSPECVERCPLKVLVYAEDPPQRTARSPQIVTRAGQTDAQAAQAMTRPAQTKIRIARVKGDGIHGGYAGAVLRIDLNNMKAWAEPVDGAFARSYIGGRGFNMRRLFDEVPKGTDPLGEDNKLMFGVGPLNGTIAPGSRFNVSAKSPQTGILGDSNAGGHFGAEIKYAGYDQVIVEGKAEKPVYIFIDDGCVEIRDAAGIWGHDVPATHELIRQELGDPGIQVACIGPSAERGVLFSGVFANIVRAAARTGMGAVMASKKVKALAVRGTGTVSAHDLPGFMEAIRRLDRLIYSHPDYAPRVRYGSTRLVSGLNNSGMLCTHHFRTGYFPAAAAVSGERLDAEFNVKNKGCFACTIPCSRYLRVKEGPFAGLHFEGPEFESLAGFTSRCLNEDLPTALKCIDICNRSGIDTITTSELVAWCMECYELGILSREDLDGIDLRWGDGRAMLALVEKIAKNEGVGRLLSGGVRRAAEQVGRGSEQFAMHIKGLEIFQGEPRGIKAYGLGNVVSSRGADHLRSEPFFELLNDPELGRQRFGVPESSMRLEWKGKGRVVKFFEHWSALADSLNLCKNTIVNMETLAFGDCAEMLTALTGLDFGAAGAEAAGLKPAGPPEVGLQAGGLEAACERIIHVERAFNMREGMSRKDDTIPARFREPLPPESKASAGSVFELEPMLDEYYAARGWDKDTGWPSRAKFESLGLGDVADRLAGDGVELPEAHGEPPEG